jgi:primosomal protein N' (replication factor Y) (superfamily II helicase)
MKYADVILPLAVANTYTFGVPFELQSNIRVGCRVEVQFGKRKIYSGIVQALHDNKPDVYEVKPIRSLLDEGPMVTEKQIQYWQWIASYYMCTVGEVMSAALPSYLKLESETYVVLNDDVNIDEHELTDDEFMVLQALQLRKEKKENP